VVTLLHNFFESTLTSFQTVETAIQKHPLRKCQILVLLVSRNEANGPPMLPQRHYRVGLSITIDLSEPSLSSDPDILSNHYRLSVCFSMLLNQSCSTTRIQPLSFIICEYKKQACREQEKEKERGVVEKRKLPLAVLQRLDCNFPSVVLDDTCGAANTPLVWELEHLFVRFY
jgi:hypothetical protein